MKECRKNASALSMTSDSIYVFGGSSNNLPTLDSIEQYSVSANKWNLLKIRMPKALCYLSTLKLDDSSVILFGGCTKERK
jgi:N-acetylneuraminic acid mutarotase